MNDCKQKYLILILFLNDMFSHIKKIILPLDPIYKILFSFSIFNPVTFIQFQFNSETIHKGLFLEIVFEDNVIKVIYNIRK